MNTTAIPNDDMLSDVAQSPEFINALHLGIPLESTIFTGSFTRSSHLG
jgi:hypothetical protein